MKQEFLFSGEIISDEGVESIARALAGCSWPIHVRKSGYDGTLYLTTTRVEEVHLDMDSGQSREFLFSGDLEASLERTLELLGDFSQRLALHGFTHRVELSSGADDMVSYFHHNWCQGQARPKC